MFEFCPWISDKEEMKLFSNFQRELDGKNYQTESVVNANHSIESICLEY